MAEFPALPLWTDSFLADTIHLDAKETGAYLMLIMSAWRSPDCCLPNDDKKLARMARCTPREWTRIKEEVLDFWYIEDDKLYQKKLNEVRQMVAVKSQKAKTAADAKWLKSKDSGNADASAKHMPQGCQPKPKPKPKKEEEAKASPKKKTNPAFIDFWEIYPKQRAGSEQKALASFERALKRASFEDIFSGVVRYAQSREVAEGYAKGAAAWLNDDRWTSEYADPPATRGGNQMVAALNKRKGRMV